MKKLIPLLALLPFSSHAADFNCQAEFNWVKNTFSQNDAGYEYAVSKKGKAALDKLTESIGKRIGSEKDIPKCRQTIIEWLDFFRDGHLNLALNDTPEYEIEKVDLSSLNLEHYFAHTETDPLEGYWEFSSYQVAIVKQANDYVGYLTESTNSSWQPGHIKIKLHKSPEGLSATYYMGDHSPTTITELEILGENHISLNNGWLIMSRTGIESDDIPSDVARYIRLSSIDKPYFEKLSKTTALLKIPSFNESEKVHIDSLIETQREQILNVDNLIIDLRGNGGGSDVSYEKLLPFLYTNPYRIVGLEFLSTPLNNQRMLKFANDPIWPDSFRDWAKTSYDVLQQRLGEFVNLEDSEVEIKQQSEIFPKPSNVAILVNNGNGSTTEQFLLAAKQSRKVKLFGQTTYGVLDISNTHRVTSPSGIFILTYSLSKSLRIPHMAIDSKGIQPDFYLDSSIPSHQWINFVQNLLEQTATH